MKKVKESDSWVSVPPEEKKKNNITDAGGLCTLSHQQHPDRQPRG